MVFTLFNTEKQKLLDIVEMVELKLAILTHLRSNACLQSEMHLSYVFKK